MDAFAQEPAGEQHSYDDLRYADGGESFTPPGDAFTPPGAAGAAAT
ncbi:hypothetical protein ACIQV3_40320 [Streptomyces sp. NPDC099050]